MASKMPSQFIQTHKDDIAIILRGVCEVPLCGAPGALTVFGPRAFPFLVGKLDECYHPVGAAARLGDGRLIIYSHDGYINPREEPNDLNTLLINNILWLSNKTVPNTVKVAIYNNDSLFKFLKSKGFTPTLVSDGTLSDVIELLKYDVLCIAISIHSKSPPSEVEACKQFVKRGGGLLAVNTAWAWDIYGISGDIRSDHKGNAIVHEAGLGWTTTCHVEATGSSGYLCDTSLLDYSHAADVWNLANMILQSDSSAQLLRHHFSILKECLQAIPLNDKCLLSKMATELNLLPSPIPTEESPVSDPLEKLIITLQCNLCECDSTCKVGFPRDLGNFPGNVSDNAVRVKNQLIQLDVSKVGMHSTGMYAPPGEQLQFEFNPPLQDINLSVQIGCHTDNISNLAQWKRFPKITTNVNLNGKRELSLLSHFGGLVYIRNSKTTTQALGKISIKISGAVPAPYFILGKTNVKEWRDDIRLRKAPWSELANDKIILTLPTKKVREILDPEPLMLFWEKILDADAEFVGLNKERSRPERIVADVQISAGYMHSGYPIMIHTDEAVDTALCIKKLQTTKAWGHFHELGHNHQESDWTFEGTVEVTCNLFTLYVLTTVCGQTFSEARDVFIPENMKRTIKKFCDGGKDFNKWKSDPFLALLMYYQLQQEFGWGAFKKVFAEYRKLGEDERPKTNQDKMNMWLIMFSRVVGYDLSEFFLSWKIPVERIALESVSYLPKSRMNISSLL